MRARFSPQASSWTRASKDMLDGKQALVDGMHTGHQLALGP